MIRWVFGLIVLVAVVHTWPVVIWPAILVVVVLCSVPYLPGRPGPRVPPEASTEPERLLYREVLVELRAAHPDVGFGEDDLPDSVR